MSKNNLENSRGIIIKHFDDSQQKIYKQTELSKVIKAHKFEWKIWSSITLRDFLIFLLEKTKFEKVTLPFPNRKETRYIWGEVSEFALALSLKDNGYLSHHSAMFLNGLTDQSPQNIYINQEQPPKKSPQVQLMQENIDLAFKNSVRTTNNNAHFKDKIIHQLSGMNTNNLGVIERTESDGELLRFTNLERTLIDIAVRPVYSGGIHEVLAAYKLAKGKVSIYNLVNTRKTINYVYPYHQVIGFYLEKAGYDDDQLAPFLELNMEFDFYLVHKMEETSYSSKWRLHYPRDF
jgi:hypothetical protein